MSVTKLVKSIRIACASGLFASWAEPAFADERWRIIVPSEAQGSTDILTRELARQMGRKLNGTVEVENQTGKSGAIAARKVLAAAPDSLSADLQRRACFARCLSGTQRENRREGRLCGRGCRCRRHRRR